MSILTDIRARLAADKAEYVSGVYDQNIRDRDALLRMIEQEATK